MPGLGDNLLQLQTTSYICLHSSKQQDEYKATAHRSDSHPNIEQDQCLWVKGVHEHRLSTLPQPFAFSQHHILLHQTCPRDHTANQVVATSRQMDGANVVVQQQACHDIPA